MWEILTLVKGGNPHRDLGKRTQRYYRFGNARRSARNLIVSGAYERVVVHLEGTSIACFDILPYGYHGIHMNDLQKGV